MIENWYSSQLRDHLNLIDPENIYYGDKLGLFRIMQTKSSYVAQDNLCRYGKQSKER